MIQNCSSESIDNKNPQWTRTASMHIKYLLIFSPHPQLNELETSNPSTTWVPATERHDDVHHSTRDGED